MTTPMTSAQRSCSVPSTTTPVVSSSNETDVIPPQSSESSYVDGALGVISKYVLPSVLTLQVKFQVSILGSPEIVNALPHSEAEKLINTVDYSAFESLKTLALSESTKPETRQMALKKILDLGDARFYLEVLSKSKYASPIVTTAVLQALHDSIRNKQYNLLIFSKVIEELYSEAVFQNNSSLANQIIKINEYKSANEQSAHVKSLIKALYSSDNQTVLQAIYNLGMYAESSATAKLALTMIYERSTNREWREVASWNLDLPNGTGNPLIA